MAKIRILGDMNLSAMCRFLGGELSHHEVIDAGFNTWLQDLLNPETLQRAQGEIWLLLLSPRILENETVFNQWDDLLKALRESGHRPQFWVSNLFIDPRCVSQPLLGLHELQERASELNRKLYEFAKAHDFLNVLDVQSLVLEKGLEALCDLRFESLGRMFFSPRGQKELAFHVARSVNASLRVPRKVLVLDLDNTLWGGILGEDGLDGIRIGGEGEGYLFSRFQSQLKELKKRGILLAIASKNNFADALEVFAKRHEMLLRREDFASLKIGWNEKALALREMAQELRLGLESFVFLDDSDFERGQMKSLNPEVSVPSFTGPEELCQILRKIPDFDVIRLTREDTMRAESYRIEVQRNAGRSQHKTLEDYFQSLQMEMVLFKAGESHLERLYQLIHKTNQFNLSGRRYERSEFEQRARDPHFLVVGLRVKDQLGESGVTGLAVIDKHRSDAWVVESLLLSCRIIGRTVEFALVRALGKHAFEQKAQLLRFSFVPTAKNQVSAQFLENSGMRKDPISWVLDAETLVKVPKDFVRTTWEGA